MTFLQGLLDIFPFASDDSEARGALWNIMARLLFQVCENEMSPTTLHQYVSVLASKSDLIEDDLLDQQLDGLKSKARTSAVSLCLLNMRSCQYEVAYSKLKKMRLCRFLIFITSNRFIGLHYESA